MGIDCNIKQDNMRFRYRVAGIIIENDCVLFATNEKTDYYYSVGGGVHIGESAEDAVKREVFEETGVEYEVDRLAFIHENFFEGDDKFLKHKHHEITLYFLMKSRGSKKLNSDSYTKGIKEYVEWIPIKDLNKYTAYPLFFREKLLDIKDGIEHIITYE